MNKEEKQEKDNAKKIREELVNLYELRDKLLEAKSLVEIQDIYNDISKRKEIVADIQVDASLSSLLSIKIKELNKEIDNLENELGNSVNDYNDSYKRMKDIVSKQDRELDNNKLLSEEEMDKIRHEYTEEQYNENKQSIKIKKNIEEKKKNLKKLNKEKKKLENDLDIVDSFGLNKDDYQKVKYLLGNKKLFDSVILEYNLSDILDKDKKDRTDEEKEILKNAKYKILSRLLNNEVDDDKDKNIINDIEALYSLNDKYEGVEKPRDILINDKDVLEKRILNLPSKIINDNKDNSKDVLKAPEDMKDAAVQYIDEKEENNNDNLENHEVKERITIFQEKDSKDVYVRKNILERFNLIPTSEEVLIDNASCYRIDEEDAADMIGRLENDDSYDLVLIGVEIENENEDVKEEVEKEESYLDKLMDYVTSNNISVYDYYKNMAEGYLTDENYNFLDFESINPFLTEEDMKLLKSSKDEKIAEYFATSMNKVIELQDKDIDKDLDVVDEIENKIKEEEKEEKPRKEQRDVIGFYKDSNGDIYISKYAVERFNVDKIGEEVSIDNKVCYKITSSDADRIYGNQDNDLSPYFIDIREIFEDEEIDNIIIYRDLDHDKKLYISNNILDSFGITRGTSTAVIEGVECSIISDESLKMLKEFLRKTEDNDLSIEYVNVHLKHKRKHKEKEEETNNKVNRSINIKNDNVLEDILKDFNKYNNKVDTYTPTNLVASDKFLDELKDGEILYNVVHKLPMVIELTKEFLSKLCNNLLNNNIIKEELDKLDKKLDNLDEEELERLREEYNNSLLQLSILDEIRNKIENRLNKDKKKDNGNEIDINELIHKLEEDYSKLFIGLKELELINLYLSSDKLKDEEVEEFNNLYNNKSKYVSSIIKDIYKNRSILDSEIISDEDIDMDISPVLNPIISDDSEIIEDKFLDALDSNDINGIIDNFIELDSNYYVGGKSYVDSIGSSFGYLYDTTVDKLLLISMFDESKLGNIKNSKFNEIITKYINKDIGEDDLLKELKNEKDERGDKFISFVDSLKKKYNDKNIVDAIDFVFTYPYVKYGDNLDDELKNNLDKIDKSSLKKLFKYASNYIYYSDMYDYFSNEYDNSNVNNMIDEDKDNTDNSVKVR